MIHLSNERELEPLPFGTNDLVSSPVVGEGARRSVYCYVQGCNQLLRVPMRGKRGDVCPTHRIRCHYSTARAATYSYLKAADNIIVSRAEFQNNIVGHPFKFESHRLGLERSEDALSWNVFRSLEKADLLPLIAEMITGQRIPYRPFLFLWGICTTNNDFQPWDLLIEARNRFETNLPVKRPLTEPDIALYLPGRYLILIEAKFTSFNTYYKDGPRANASSLTLEELRGIYQSNELQTLDHKEASRAKRIHYQLWRNMVFAEWMAQRDHAQTEPFHVNLVCERNDQASAEEFRQLIRPKYKHRFQRLTWEAIYRRMQDRARAARLVRYMYLKTAGLKPAFNLKSTT